MTVPVINTAKPNEDDSIVSEPNAQVVQVKAKKHRWLTPLPVILALLLGIIGTSAFFLLPDLMADKGAYDILKEYIEKDHVAMELSSKIAIGEESYPVSALLERMNVNGQRVTAISENGRTLYYSDGTVFMENGAAYQISTELPDYSQILELTMRLYKHIDVSEVNGVYSITAKENDAEEIMKLLLPSAAYLPDIDSLLVELRTNNGTLSQINISGNGLFDDEAHTAYSISTVLTITEKTQQEIPAAVKEALVNNVPEGTGTLTDDLCRLLTGWQNLNETSPLVADISFDVDCGVLDLNEQLKLYRWNVSDMQIYSVQKNGYGLYFTENSICDSNGTRISAANAANVDTAKLLDILYTVCMNGSVQCKINDDQYTYVLALDEDGMAEVAYAIAPETKKLNITFISGSIRVVVEQEEIQCVEVSISGSVQVVLSKTDASITAALDFTKGGEASLPDAAKAALTGEK